MGQSIIEVNKLSKKFGNFTAVDKISFKIKEGEIFAFLGPNGAGKTTTIKMLTTLLAPSSGVITINGNNPVTQKDAVRKSFGIVFQDPSLDEELTAFENMDFHGVIYHIDSRERKQRVDELLKYVDLWERRDSLVKTFSGGMKRRLEIARGLLHHPKIIFLDEPTLGLDPQTRNSMWEYLHRINKQEKITIFITTHYMEEAEKHAERIAIIDNGKIIAEGSSPELKLKTKTKSLEEAFLKLTGHAMREETSSRVDRMRAMGRMWRRR